MAKRQGTKKERAEYISSRAMELAASGQYGGWYQIEQALRDEGYDEARQQLDHSRLRQELDALCRQYGAKVEAT